MPRSKNHCHYKALKASLAKGWPHEIPLLHPAGARAFGGSLLVEDQTILIRADQDRFAIMEGAVQDLFSQRIFQRTLNRSSHRTGTILRIVATADEKVFGFVIEL